MDSDEADELFSQACDRLMEAIDAFHEAGLDDEEIMAEVKARLLR